MPRRNLPLRPSPFPAAIYAYCNMSTFLRRSSKVGGSTASWALEDEASQRVIGQQLVTTASKEHPGNENTALLARSC